MTQTASSTRGRSSRTFPDGPPRHSRGSIHRGAGLIAPDGGTVRFEGDDITGLKPHGIARRGIARSFQITDVFGGLTAFENVRLAAQVGHEKRDSLFGHVDALESVNEAAQQVLEDIGLDDRADHPAADFAYGDRRKLEIGLTVANDPDLLLLDEPTEGLAPQIIEDVLDIIERMVEEGVTILLAEQNIHAAMAVADRHHVIDKGRIVFEGTTDGLQVDEDLQERHLGVGVEATGLFD